MAFSRQPCKLTQSLNQNTNVAAEVTIKRTTSLTDNCFDLTTLPKRQRSQCHVGSNWGRAGAYFTQGFFSRGLSFWACKGPPSTSGMKWDGDHECHYAMGQKKVVNYWMKWALQWKKLQKAWSESEDLLFWGFYFSTLKTWLWRSLGVENPQVSIKCSTSCGNNGFFVKEVSSLWWALKHLLMAPARLAKGQKKRLNSGSNEPQKSAKEGEGKVKILLFWDFKFGNWKLNLLWSSLGVENPQVRSDARHPVETNAA